MYAFFMLVLVFLLLLLLFGVVGIGIRFLLHWIIPAIGVDIGTLIGVVSVGWVARFYVGLMSIVTSIPDGQEADDSEIGTIVLKTVRPTRPSKRKK